MNTITKIIAETQSFDFNTKQVRVVSRDGSPWFVAKDVCDALGIGNPSMAVASLEEDEVTLSTIEGSHRPTNLISESGLYALIFQSRKAEAKAFRKWVTSTVLPAIRKTGSYVSGEEHLDPTAPDYLDRLKDLMIEAQERKIAAQAAELKKAQPLAAAFERNMMMTGGMGIQEYARSKGLGPNKFAKWLQVEGFISKKERGAKTIYTPYARKNKGGLFETVKHQHGQLVRITAKGVLFFDRLVEEGKVDFLSA
ncbi:BRO family, N-terminal domain protein [Rhodobacterales bacterium Y4I]|nr:BRO family, N-terminal domain protein [Rhodobacterales bacterium Y4I]